MSEHFFRLDGRVAVVTGGGQSVGEGIARRLTQAGARVCIFDVNDATARQVADSIGGIRVQGDVTSWADVQKCVAACERELGPVAILVNNAAIGGKVACI